MYLYSLTLQQATGIICAINGNFSGGKTQEIAVARGKILDLLRPDENGKIQTIHSVEVFGAIRSLAQFRLTGAHKDYIVVGSDSGRIVILEYNKEKNVFDKVHQETFGKSGTTAINHIPSYPNPRVYGRALTLISESIISSTTAPKQNRKTVLKTRQRERNDTLKSKEHRERRLPPKQDQNPDLETRQ
ncbi:unnamed protein product [Arabis nemorensis]|uniref:RSE1/DDB1/CPSF1 first beta-propeller domain-containing protein n=1 Tax=Arabis nemorensis TaxID=586526 RepID=A0A565BWI5_9BRAS|nr:unnamed protein product [Arabis nemorensis]